MIKKIIFLEGSTDARFIIKFCRYFFDFEENSLTFALNGNQLSRITHTDYTITNNQIHLDIRDCQSKDNIKKHIKSILQEPDCEYTDAMVIVDSDKKGIADCEKEISAMFGSIKNIRQHSCIINEYLDAILYGILASENNELINNLKPALDCFDDNEITAAKKFILMAYSKKINKSHDITNSIDYLKHFFDQKNQSINDIHIKFDNFLNNE